MNLILNPLKKFLDFIVYSNFFISLCVALFTIQGALIFPNHSEIILEFALPNFIATFILYNLQRLYLGAKHPENPKYKWHTNNRRLIFTLISLVIICCYSSIWMLFSENNLYLIGYASLSVLSIFYFLPPLNLRKYGLIKPFNIAFVFICTSIIIPLISLYNIEVLVYAIGQFSFIAALAILFDIRDLVNDKEENIITIPLKFGIQTSKFIVVALLLLYFVSSLYLQQSNLIVTSLIILSISILSTILSLPTRHNYFYLFFVDGLIILQCLLLLFIKN